MTEQERDIRLPEPDLQTGFLFLSIGSRISLKIAIKVSPPGLLAIGATVAGILLSSAVIVHTATKRSVR
jgi:hypothetical protein